MQEEIFWKKETCKLFLLLFVFPRRKFTQIFIVSNLNEKRKEF